MISERFLPLLPLLLLGACRARPVETDRPFGPATRVVEATAGRALEVNWKERRAQPYVYVEHIGDYRVLGDSMRAVLSLGAAAGLETAGPPFALFFDDPARVPAGELRSRACLPVGRRPEGLGTELRYDVLPSAMVVYGRVAGAYPEVPRAYPALLGYMKRLGWTPGAPVREIYLVDPGQVANTDELVAEVQIPWTAR
jgi:effector-binding domain-containing protein